MVRRGYRDQCVVSIQAPQVACTHHTDAYFQCASLLLAAAADAAAAAAVKSSLQRIPLACLIRALFAAFRIEMAPSQRAQ